MEEHQVDYIRRRFCNVRGSEITHTYSTARLGFYLCSLVVLCLSGKALRAPVSFLLRISFPCNRSNAFPTIYKSSLLNPHLKPNVSSFNTVSRSNTTANTNWEHKSIDSFWTNHKDTNIHKTTKHKQIASYPPENRKIQTKVSPNPWSICSGIHICIRTKLPKVADFLGEETIDLMILLLHCLLRGFFSPCIEREREREREREIGSGEIKTDTLNDRGA